MAGIATKLFLAVTLFFYEPYAWWLAFAVILSGLLLHYFAKGRVEIEAHRGAGADQLSARSSWRDTASSSRSMIPRHIGARSSSAAIIAENNGGELLLMTRGGGPDRGPDGRCLQEGGRGPQEDAGEAQAGGGRQGECPPARVVSVSHDVITAIIDTAKEETVNMIVIGWKGYTHTQEAGARPQDR